MADDPIRWGVLGARSDIWLRAIEPQLAASDAHTVVARASRGDDGGDAAYAELLRDPSVEAVYIPLPNGLHHRWVLAALEAGKHVLCEKPLGMTEAEAAAMHTAAADAGRLLVEAYASPYHPANQLVQQLVTEGELGELVFAHHAFTYRHSRPDVDHRYDPVLGNGSLLDLGCYVVGPLLWATGREPERVTAAARRSASGVEVSLSGWLDFGPALGRGFRALVETSFEAPHRRNQELVGTDGVLRRPRAWFPAEDDTVIEITRPDDAVDRFTCAGGNAYRRMVDAFAALVRRGERPLFGTADSLRLARTLDRLAAAAP